MPGIYIGGPTGGTGGGGVIIPGTGGGGGGGGVILKNPGDYGAGGTAFNRLIGQRFQGFYPYIPRRRKFGDVQSPYNPNSLVPTSQTDLSQLTGLSQYPGIVGPRHNQPGNIMAPEGAINLGRLQQLSAARSAYMNRGQMGSIGGGMGYGDTGTVDPIRRLLQARLGGL